MNAKVLDGMIEAIEADMKVRVIAVKLPSPMIESLKKDLLGYQAQMLPFLIDEKIQEAYGIPSDCEGVYRGIPIKRSPYYSVSFVFGDI